MPLEDAETLYEYKTLPVVALKRLQRLLVLVQVLLVAIAPLGQVPHIVIKDQMLPDLDGLGRLVCWSGCRSIDFC